MMPPSSTIKTQAAGSSETTVFIRIYDVIPEDSILHEEMALKLPTNSYAICTACSTEGVKSCEKYTRGKIEGGQRSIKYAAHVKTSSKCEWP
jgi:hypothetical protein